MALMNIFGQSSRSQSLAGRGVQPRPTKPPREHASHATGRIGGATTTECSGDTSRNVESAITIAPIIAPIAELIQRVILYLSSVDVPGIAETVEAYLANQLSEDEYRCLMRLNGANPDAFNPVLAARRDRLTPQELIQWGRRHDIDDDQTATALRDYGWLNKDEREARVELYDELPTIADHLHWLTRNADDKQYVIEYGLLDGFAPDDVIKKLPGYAAYNTLTDVKGRNFWATFGHDLRARGMLIEYAANHYAAHWLLPSPTQLREFLYRKDEILEKTRREFTIQDLDRLLAEQDYSPLSRSWFVATAYNVPAISYIKEWYRQGVIDKAQLTEYHHRLGFAPIDAERFADIDDLQKRRMRTSSSHGWTTAAASNAWAAGQIETGQHTEIYQGLGYTLEEAESARKRAEKDYARSILTRARSRVLTSTISEVKNALRVGVITQEQAVSALEAVGWPDKYARGLAKSEAVAAQVDRVKQVVTAVRRAYLRGELTGSLALSVLVQAGIIREAVDSYLAIWDLQRTQRHRTRTAQQVLSDLSSGFLSEGEAVARWNNLGYDDADIRLYMAQAQSKLAALQARRLAVQQRQDKAAQAALAKAARDAQRLNTAIRKKLMRVAPVSKLQKWASMGLIGHDLFLSRMRLYGYPPEAIARFWEEACAKKTAACKEVVPTDAAGLGSGTGLP